MTPITLQIALPEQLELTEAELARITGKPSMKSQMKWLQDNQWEYTLSLDKGVVVGTLYAHLRLAGLHPAHVAAPAANDGFDMSAVR